VRKRTGFTLFHLPATVASAYKRAMWWSPALRPRRSEHQAPGS